MILVCGGAGYIGSHMVLELLAKGEAVAVLDNLRTGHRRALPPEARFFEGDLRDAEFLDRVFREVETEAVIHFAAHSQVGESTARPLRYYDNNLHGTGVLLSAMLRRGAGLIVFSSSAAVYGEPGRTPLKETDPVAPVNPYGETKRAAEKMLQYAAAAHGPRFAALRYFNAAGADPEGRAGEDHRPESHLIPLVLQVPLKLKAQVDIFGDDYETPDGSCVRDYVHVTDLAAAHLLALERLRRGASGEIFNLGSDKGYSVKEIVAAAERVVGRAIPAKTGRRRPGDPPALVADSAKAREVLGWRPRHSGLEDIIQSAWNWHKNHPAGFGD